MRKLLPLALVLLAAPAFAQLATKQVPTPRADEHNYRAESYFNTSDGGGRWQVELSVRDSGGNEIRRMSISGPGAPCGAGATAVAFNDAIMTPIGGEVGGNVRKVRARILEFLRANSCFGETVSVAP